VRSLCQTATGLVLAGLPMGLLPGGVGLADGHDRGGKQLDRRRREQRSPVPQAAAAAGGLWLCRTRVRSGLTAVVVPSPCRVIVQPQR
jgi:hypothetical protein